MTDDVKKAAEEYAKTCLERTLAAGGFKTPSKEYQDALSRVVENAFLAGDAHGFARAVKMLRSVPIQAVMHTAGAWAAWLEEQEKSE